MATAAIEVSIIVISYNTRALTLDAIRSIYEQTTAITFEVFVFDNASDDGSADQVAAAFPQVRLIRSHVNLGFAAANNIAADAAQGKYLLLLNPDTLVLDGAIQKLVRASEDESHEAIFGGRTLYPDRSLNPASCWGKPTIRSVFCQGIGLSRLFRGSTLFNAEAYGGWMRDDCRQVDIVSGCFMLIRNALWKRLGGFDPDFFIYGEDADFCLRAARLGIRRIHFPGSQIIHRGGASEPVLADKIVKLFRAKAQLFHRHWSPRAAGVGVALLNLWVLVRLISFRCLRLFGRGAEQYVVWRSAWRRRDAWANDLSHRAASEAGLIQETISA